MKNSITSFIVLAILLPCECSVSDIVKIVGTTKSNISQRLKTLEMDDLIVRNTLMKGGDGRVRMVSLTKKGTKVAEEFIKMTNFKDIGSYLLTRKRLTEAAQLCTK